MIDLSSQSAPSDCRLCPLHTQRTQVVHPDVLLNTPDPVVIVAIGEAPGAKEDEQGKPFVGASGKILREQLSALPGTVVITNTVKCRPPGNRDPHVGEKEACRPFLRSELATVKPDLIVLVGRHAMNEFLDEKQTGNVSKCSGKLVADRFVPIIHPASTLYNAKNRPLWDRSWEAINSIIDDKLAHTKPDS